MGTTIEGLNFANLASDDRVTFRGKAMTARTAAAVIAKERRAKMTAPIVQGGYNPGGVGASGGTHDLDGCIDWSVAGMSAKKRTHWVHAGRDVGWCDWYRPTLYQNGALVWYQHNHGALDKAAHASQAAKDQWPDYLADGNGLYPLVGHDDSDKYRPHPPVVFSYADFVLGLKNQSRIDDVRHQIAHLVRQAKATRRKILARRKQLRNLTHH